MFNWLKQWLRDFIEVPELPHPIASMPDMELCTSVWEMEDYVEPLPTAGTYLELVKDVRYLPAGSIVEVIGSLPCGLVKVEDHSKVPYQQRYLTAEEYSTTPSTNSVQEYLLKVGAALNK